ncbi:hypothetical protein CVT24_010708 [Panaeolus cyanescens]|uniref:HNH nuclease domain-containing protein n=1 Tax=Panaeolus cyanescens TaxID=181874 RepID=A0A409YVZ2_9AGAR|nr:hypothetical protein CVT24_010708 [Panaeolus cyanescens]
MPGSNSNRCLIENCAEVQAVQKALVFDKSKSLKYHIVESLEWSWGLKKGSLDLDIPQNFFFLGASLHQMYREWKWVLIPEASALDQFLDPDFLWSYGRGEFPEVKENTFKYMFQPVFDMEDVYITRVSDEDSRRVDIHEYPFDKFPVITSTIDPRFAILHVGQMLATSAFELSIKRELRSKYPWLAQLEQLYFSWVALVPREALKDPTYMPRPDGYVSSGSESSGSEVYVEVVYFERERGRESAYSSSAGPSTAPPMLPHHTVQHEVVPDIRPHFDAFDELIQGEVAQLTHHALQKQDDRTDLQPSKWTTSRISSWALANACTIPPSPKKSIKPSNLNKSRRKEPRAR